MNSKYKELIINQVSYFSGEESARCADRLRTGLNDVFFKPLGIDSKDEDELFKRYDVVSKTELMDEVNQIPEIKAFFDTQKRHGIHAELDYRQNDTLGNYMLYIKLSK